LNVAAVTLSEQRAYPFRCSAHTLSKLKVCHPEHPKTGDDPGRKVVDEDVEVGILPAVEAGGTTRGVSDLSLEQRCVAPDDRRVETVSLNMGSANFDEGVHVSTLPDMRYWAARMKDAGVQPELQIFEGGMINNVLILAEEGCLSPPYVFVLCLGFRGALPASPYNLHSLKGMLPAGAPWGFTHHGVRDFSLSAAALGMGATTVRVGFEDSVAPLAPLLTP